MLEVSILHQTREVYSCVVDFLYPNEVIGILLAEADGHYQLIDTSFWIDGGDVVVNVSKFDPANFSTLNLSVLPLLPDSVPWLSTFLNNF